MTQPRFIKHSIWQLSTSMKLGDVHVPAGTKFRVEYPRRGDFGGVPIKFMDFDIASLIGERKSPSFEKRPKGTGVREFRVYDYTLKTNRFVKADFHMNEDKLRKHCVLVDEGDNHEYLLFNGSTGSFWNGSYAFDPHSPRVFVSLENALVGVVGSIMRKKSIFKYYPEYWTVVKRGVHGPATGEPIPLPRKWLRTMFELKKIYDDSDDAIVQQNLRPFINLLTRIDKDILHICHVADIGDEDRNWVKENLPNTQIYNNTKLPRSGLFSKFVFNFMLLCFYDEDELVLAKLNFIPRMRSLLDGHVID